MPTLHALINVHMNPMPHDAYRRCIDKGLLALKLSFRPTTQTSNFRFVRHSV